MLGDGRRGQGILVPADQGRADDRVGAGLDNGNVGNAIVRSADLDRHRNDLASGIAEDLTGIRERHTLAVPHAAVGVRALQVLESTLDVAIMVRVLLVEDLVTASGLETITGETGLGRADEAVGGNGRDEASEGSDGGVGFHCCGLLGLRRKEW